VAASQHIGQRLLPRRSGSTRHDACTCCSLQSHTSPTPVIRRRRSRSPRSASSLAHSPRPATAGPPFPSSSSPRASSQRQVPPSLACPIHPPNDAARDSIPIEPAAPLVLHLPRLRALALLRRRPAARVESATSRRPRNLHISCRTDRYPPMSAFTGNGNRVHPVAVTLSIQTAPLLIGQLWRRLPWRGGGRETRWS
jgi:hypothetical protein